MADYSTTTGILQPKYIVWAGLHGDGGLICLGNLDKTRKGLHSWL